MKPSASLTGPRVELSTGLSYVKEGRIARQMKEPEQQRRQTTLKTTHANQRLLRWARSENTHTPGGAPNFSVSKASTTTQTSAEATKLMNPRMRALSIRLFFFVRLFACILQVTDASSTTGTRAKLSQIKLSAGP